MGLLCVLTVSALIHWWWYSIIVLWDVTITANWVKRLWCLSYNCMWTYAAAAAKLLQSCLTLCDPIDSSPPVSPIPGILQARTLEWVAISLSSAWKWKVKAKSLSHVRPSVTPWTAAFQAPPSMGFSRQEYWSGVPWPSPTIGIDLNNIQFLIVR